MAREGCCVVNDYPKNPATALNTAVARSVDQEFKDVVMCVERGPNKLTDVQKTQLRVLLGMYARANAALGRWAERLRHKMGVATTTISPRLVLRETQPHATTAEDPRYPEDASTLPMRRSTDLGDA